MSPAAYGSSIDTGRGTGQKIPPFLWGGRRAMMRWMVALLLGLTTPSLAAAQAEEAWIKKGREAEQQSDFDVAIACFAKAIQINPRSVPAHIEYGTSHVEHRNPKKDEGRAIASLNEAVRLGP